MDRENTVSAWMRGLWTRVLFPGADPVPGRVPLLHLALLLVVPGLLLYPFLGFRLFEPDESRYAQIPLEMLQRGDWVLPTLQGEPYLDKPPLFYWLVMLSYRAFGVHDWAARLVPALAVHLTLLLGYLFGRRSAGDRAAFLGTLALALSPGFLGMGRLLVLDGLLMLLVVLAVFAAWEAIRGERLAWGWWLLSSGAAGLGVLVKGPVVLILLVPPLLLFPWLAGKGVRPGWKAWGTMLGVVALLAAPWFIALSLRRPEFVGYFFWEHNVQRFLAPGVHVRGVWFYLPVLLLVLLPASLAAWPCARFFLSPETGGQRGPALGFCLLAGGWCVLFFTLSSCKLPTYVLPALPLLALGIGAFLASWASARTLRVGAGVSFALLLAVHGAAVPWYAAYRSPMSRPAEVLALCADPSASVVCYPRGCDSVAFYLGRSDLKVFRSKDIEELRTLVRVQPRTVILCTHRHSLDGLKQLLPPEVRITREVRMGLADIHGVPKGMMKGLKKAMGETALGLSDLAVVEMPTLAGRGGGRE
ncbi:MAG: glycosyltransferase family 39 protein [Gemmataceae bacterium]|nr:glycosyltransferase family 39 protein [Gemmataceae bacterium]